MNSKLTILLTGLLMVVLAACGSSEASPAEDQLKKLKETYPEMESELEKLPEDFRDEITVPDPDTIPLTVSDVEAVAETKLKPYTMNFYYAEEKKRLNVWIHDHIDNTNDSLSTGEEPNANLTNDIKGYYSEGGGISKLMWLSENKNAVFSIQSVVPPEAESPFEKEDMVKIANSIIEQR